MEDNDISIKDYTIIKVVQATHHQGDVRYGSLDMVMPVTWTLFRSLGMWNKIDLDCTLGKGDQLFIFTGTFRYLGMEDLQQEFSVENSSINVEFWENDTEENTAGAYLITVWEIVNAVY